MTTSADAKGTAGGADALEAPLFSKPKQEGKIMEIERFFDAVVRQDAETMADYFCRDAIVRWHCTNERFTAEEYIRANCQYPGYWRGELERVIKKGDCIVTAARVYAADGAPSFHVASFYRLREGRIAELDEYWGDDGPAPAWRRSLGLGMPIPE